WGTALNDHRRPVVASAELHPDRSKLLAEACKYAASGSARGFAGRRAVLDCGVNVGLADIGCQTARCLCISQRDRHAFGFLRQEEFTTAPPLQRGCELPGEIRRIVNARVHAEAAGWREQMHGITAEQRAAIAIMLGDERHPCRPGFVRDDLCLDFETDTAPHG